MFQSIKSLINSQSDDESTPNKQATIVLVGHCGADCSALKRAVKQAAANAQIERANSNADLEPHRHRGALWLINRQLDGRFTHTNGVEMIRATSQHDDPPIMMLISNYEDAQQHAIEAGAEPAFGKSQVKTDLARERLQSAISRTQLNESTQ